ncbi:hypothetical protein [Streptomyces sp. bgisy091]|uniref:hypothetical protein n=1 Tax=Streptomyces sp. bgisy091 TaxID=3413778 RepID=UPI003D735FA5
MQDELVRLEESQQVLTKMQDVLGGTPQQAAKQGKGGRVPAARGSNGKKAAAAAGRKTSRKTGEPTWLELTTAYMGGQREPRSAAEVAASLAEAHPERAVQVAVVRNSLEQGVAQGLLERTKQGRSVFYSPTAPATAPSGS